MSIEFAQITKAGSSGNPIEINTPEGMAAAITESNIGKFYKYTGPSTADYNTGDLYIVQDLDNPLVDECGSSGSSGTPIEIDDPYEMNNLVKHENIGKVYKYIGETVNIDDPKQFYKKYENGKMYIVSTQPHSSAPMIYELMKGSAYIGSDGLYPFGVDNKDEVGVIDFYSFGGDTLKVAGLLSYVKPLLPNCIIPAFICRDERDSSNPYVFGFVLNTDTDIGLYIGWGHYADTITEFLPIMIHDGSTVLTQNRMLSSTSIYFTYLKGLTTADTIRVNSTNYMVLTQLGEDTTYDTLYDYGLGYYKLIIAGNE